MGRETEINKKKSVWGTILLFLCFCLILFLELYFPSQSLSTNYLLNPQQFFPDWAKLVWSLLLFFSGLLVFQFSSEITLLTNSKERYRSFLFSTLLFLLFPFAWGQNLVIAILPFFALYYHCLFTLYRQREVPFEITNCGLLLGVSILLWPPIGLLLPLFLYDFYQVQAFSIRNILAFFVGLFTPFFLSLSILYLLGDLSSFIAEFTVFFRESVFTIKTLGLMWGEILSTSLLLLLFVVGILINISSLKLEKVRIFQFWRVLLRSIFFFIPIFFYPRYATEFSLLTILPISVLMSRIDSRRGKILLITPVVLLLLYICIEQYPLLSTLIY